MILTGRALSLTRLVASRIGLPPILAPRMTRRQRRQLLGAAAALRRSPYFDADWYQATYADAARSPWPPELHYLLFGGRAGLDPGPHFSSTRYHQAYPDVAWAGMNPLLHFVRYGEQEGREPVAPPAGIGRAEQAAGPAIRLPFGDSAGSAAMPRGAVAVHAHLAAAGWCDRVIRALGNLSCRFDLFVSVAGDVDRSDVARRIAAAAPHAVLRAVRRVDGAGRDIAPMLATFGRRLLGYDCMCHVHALDDAPGVAPADWQRQRLHALLGSPATVEAICDRLARDPGVGIIFPEPHRALRGDHGWGGLLATARRLGARVGARVEPEGGAPFPIGSMFWARPAALRPLLDGALELSDFATAEDPAGEHAAAALERLFGAVALQQGFRVMPALPVVRYDAIHTHGDDRRYGNQVCDEVAAAIALYRRSRGRANRVVVYTAIIAGYDPLRVPERLDPAIDYVCFTDSPTDGGGVFDIRAVDCHHADPTRAARYVKTHPHLYLEGYDVAIWVDANVLIRGDLRPYVDRLLASGLPFMAIPHPKRDCCYAEAETCKQLRKDDPGIIDRQMERYRARGMPPGLGLSESSVFICRPGDPAMRAFLDRWWREIDHGSRRDQLGLSYTQWSTGIGPLPLLGELHSARDHPDFAWFKHGEVGYANPAPPRPADARIDPYAGPSYAANRAARIAAQSDRAVDIVVCVHDALDDTRLCLQSVLASLGPRHRLIVIDDGSSAATRAYLDHLALAQPALQLHRNDRAWGYTRAANLGMRLSTAGLVILLNSDTIVQPGWIEKLADAMFTTGGVGLVGPLSNAASHQSIPDHRGGAGQTAVNALPPGLGPADLDRLCEAWTIDGLLPRVPLVHGFCLAIRREVIEAIGHFDEAGFPHGYGEEDDYCLRAADAGFGLAIATHTFVAHAKSRSYGLANRRVLAAAGGAVLARKHGEQRIRNAVASLEANPMLERIRRLAAALYEDRPDPRPETARHRHGGVAL